MSRKTTAVCTILMLMLSGCSTSESTVAAATPQTDFTGPYINITQYEFTTVKGKSIDFSNITGYDDVDGLLKVRLEGYVDYNKPGDYYPSLTCTDLSGNKSSVTITVHVVDTLPTPSASALINQEIVPAPSPSGCDAKQAEDAGSPCGIVPDEELDDYSIIYEGESGKDACLAAADSEEDCVEIDTNDGTFWGYGLKNN